MKILHVSDCYLPDLGGIEIQVHDLASRQLAAGHDVRVLTSTPAGPAAPARPALSAPEPAPGAGSAPVTRVRTLPAHVPTAGTRRELRAILLRENPDLVHIHSSVVSPFAWSAAALASAARVPTALTMHSVMPWRRSLLPLSGAIGGWADWRVAWSAVSEVAAGPLRGVLGPARVRVLPNGIDPSDWYTPLPRRRAAALTIISVMRLARRKRPLPLLRTLAEIRRSVPESVPLRAVLIGDGPQQALVERAVQAGGMAGWVSLTGRLSRARIRPLLAEADVYLAPADLESFGIAALEARCAGLPVIAMAAGGVGEFIGEGREGYLVRSDREMAAVTAKLLTSPGLRQMQEHNRRTVPDLTWSRVLGLAEELYGEATTRAERAPSPFHPHYQGS